MGAWIETPAFFLAEPFGYVAPYMGAWIETMAGLSRRWRLTVAPYMGAWIETPRWFFQVGNKPGRSLHGGVD